MECGSCGSVNRLDAKFCGACGNAFPRDCSECGNRLGPGSKFCDECGAAVAGNEPSSSASQIEGEAVRKIVTVLFCDLAGSTALGEAVDAEAVREAMARYHAMVQSAIADHNGTLVKFIGDGALAVFGIPEVAEDDADRAVAAGLHLQEKFEPIALHIASRYGKDVALRVGINTGEVIIAEDDADLVGDVLNTAARLEANCPLGQVLAGEETWRLTRSRVKYEPLGEIQVKGKHDLVAAFQAISASAVDDAATTPFVGRTAELAALRRAFDRAVVERSAQMVTVIGSPGVGKTRLAFELARAYAATSRTFDVRVERSGTATFSPIADLVRDAVGIDTDLTADETLARLAELIPESSPDRDRIVALLGSFVGASSPRSTEEMFFAVRRLVEILGEHQPLLIVVDDIQWAQPLFLELLEHLVEWVRDASLLLVALARPEIRELRPAMAEPGRWVASVLSIEGLDAGETERLAGELLGGERLPAELAARLPQSTEGNPLFVRELVRMLVDDGVIARTIDGWEVTVDAEAIAVPPTIQSLLATRVERLPPDERHVVELASVVGSEFARGAVLALDADLDRRSLDVVLERLRRTEIIDPTGSYWGDEPIFRFHHVLIRDAAYRRLLKERRAELHVGVGEWIERTAAELVGEFEPTIAFHFEQAYQYRAELGGDEVATGERAAGLLHSAAVHALDRDDLAAAGALADRALACLGEQAPSRPEVLLVACEARLGSGDVTAATAVLEALDATAATPRLEAWRACFHGQLINLSSPEQLSIAESAVGAAATQLAEIGDQAGVAKAHQVRAGTLARLGRVGEAEGELDLALTAARAADDRRRVTAVLGSAPAAALWGPSPVPRAGGRCLDVIRLLRLTSGSPAVEATSVRCQAVLEALRGRFDTARTMLESSRATAQELGLRQGLMETEFYAGLVELFAGDAVAAEGHLRIAYSGLGARGIAADAGQAAAYLARSLLMQGQLDEADDLAMAAGALAGQNTQTLIAARAVTAEILAARGEFAEALVLAEEAVTLASGRDILVDHANANMALARVREAAGDPGGGDEARAEAQRLFDLKGATIRVGESRAEPTARMASAPSDATRLVNAATAIGEALIDASSRGDSDRFGQLLADDCVREDRRRIATTPSISGRIEWLDSVQSRRDAGFAELTTTTLAVRGDDLALLTISHATTAGFASPALIVISVAGGRLVRRVSFEVDDLASAVDELDGQYLASLPLLDRRHYAEYLHFDHLVARGDVEAAMAEFAADCAVVDHRDFGWGPSSTIRERIESLVQVDMEVFIYNTQIHHWEPGVSCCSRRYVIRSSDGGQLEQDIIAVLEIDPASGLVRRIDQFGDDQLDEALAFTQHKSSSAAWRQIPKNAATWFGAALDRAATEADLESFLADTAESGVLLLLGGAERVITPAELRSGAVSMAELGFGIGERELVAVRGDRLGLVRKLRSDGSALLVVEELDEAMRLAAVVHFSADQHAEAIDTLESRFLQDRPDASTAGQVSQALANSATRVGALKAAQLIIGRTGDFDGSASPDFVFDDRRSVIGRQTYGPELAAEAARLLGEDTSRLRTTVLATRLDRLALVRAQFDFDGFELDVLNIESVDEHGRHDRTVMFDVEDMAAAFDELNRLFFEGEGAPFAGFYASAAVMSSALNRRDLAAFADAVPAGFHAVDHRPMGWGELDRDQFIDLISAPEALNRGITGIRAIHAYDELGGAVASQFTFVETADDLVQPMWQYVTVSRVDHGNPVTEFYPADQLDRALARFHEFTADSIGPPGPENECTRIRRASANDADYMREVVAVRGRKLALTSWDRGTTDGVVESWLEVAELDGDGLMSRSVTFDIDALPEALAELDRWYANELGPAAAGLRGMLETQQSLRNRTMQDIQMFFDPGCETTDHRALGFGTLSAADRLKSLAEISEELFVYYPEIHRIEPGLTCASTRWLVTAPGGVATVQDTISVNTFDLASGLVSQVDMFGEDALDEALALCAAKSPAAGVTPDPSNWASVAGARLDHLTRLGETERMTGRLAASCLFVEAEGSVVAGSAMSVDDRVDLYRRNFGGSDRNVLAVRDERLAMVAKQIDGSPVIVLEELDASGLLCRVGRYPADQLARWTDTFAGALADLEQRWILGCPEPEVARLGTLLTETINAGDWDALASLLEDDFGFVDRRKASWGELDRRGYLDRLRANAELTAGVVVYSPVVHNLDDRGVVAHTCMSGEFNGARVEWEAETLWMVADGRFRLAEYFEDGDVDGALARFAGLCAPPLAES